MGHYKSWDIVVFSHDVFSVLLLPRVSVIYVLPSIYSVMDFSSNSFLMTLITLQDTFAAYHSRTSTHTGSLRLINVKILRSILSFPAFLLQSFHSLTNGFHLVPTYDPSVWKTSTYLFLAPFFIADPGLLLAGLEPDSKSSRDAEVADADGVLLGGCDGGPDKGPEGGPCP